MAVKVVQRCMLPAGLPCPFLSVMDHCCKTQGLRIQVKQVYINFDIIVIILAAITEFKHLLR